MQKKVSFQSGANRLSAVLHTQDDGITRAAFIVLHGFGGFKDAPNVRLTAEFLAAKGYVALRPDMRGCGESEGERGHILCLDQVADTQAAIDFLQSQEGVDPERIGVIGSSFGAAVTIYIAGIDSRVAAAISASGWGNGERKFRHQHSAPGAYERFVLALDEGRRARERGEKAMMSRYDIVPIPQHMRGMITDDAIMSFPVETAQSMFDFRAEDVVSQIAPRPLLLIHASADSVTPTTESVELFKRTNGAADLMIFTGVDHFLLAESNPRVLSAIEGWLEQYIPARRHAS